MDNKVLELAEKVMTYAKNSVSVKLRFMQSAVFMLNTKTYGGTVAMDGVNFYYNPEYILRAYKTHPNCLERMFLHSLLHGVLRDWLVPKNVVEDLWDICCDITVESIINELGIYNIPEQELQENALETLRQKVEPITALNLYKYFVCNTPSEKELKKLINTFTSDDHSFWYKKKKRTEKADAEEEPGEENDKSENNEKSEKKGDKSENDEKSDNSNADDENSEDSGEDSDSDSGMSKEQEAALAKQWQEIFERINMDMSMFSGKQKGKSGTLALNLENLNREEYDYATFLREFSVMTEVMKVSEDEFDYNFYTYGMNMYGNMPLIEPLEYKDDKQVHDFVIAIDTSGSVMGETVRTFVQKTYNILKQNECFSDKINVHIIQCDYRIREDVKITSQEEFDEYIKTLTVKGFGTTDFRPVFDYVDWLVDKGEFSDLRGLIYLTDGYGKFPEIQPEYKTAFILNNDAAYNHVPIWAVKMVIGKDGI